MKTTGINDSLSRRFVLRHAPMLLWGGLITFLSSLSNIQTPETMDFPVDKVAHFIEYAIFALLTWRSFSSLLRSKSAICVVLLSLLFLSAFALLDEYHQSFVPGRQADWLDFAADFAGASAALLLAWLKWGKPRESGS